MFAEDEEKVGYVIDENRRATPMRQHEMLRSYWKKPEEYVRIYTIAEAVEPVRKLIG